MMITRLFLIRHGTTEWNKKRRYCGSTNAGLNSIGRAQAAKLRRRLRDMEFDRIYSSGMKRALQTCGIIFKAGKITIARDLREINFGALEGLTHEEIMENPEPSYKKWLKDPFKNHIPGAERMNIFKNRVQKAMKKIACINTGKTAAVVCHGGVIAIFLSGVLKKKNFWNHIPSAASITVVEYRKGAAKIKVFNDTAHLR
jgi:alpha-ribazole phosphatase